MPNRYSLILVPCKTSWSEHLILEMIVVVIDAFEGSRDVLTPDHWYVDGAVPGQGTASSGQGRGAACQCCVPGKCSGGGSPVLLRFFRQPVA